MFATVYIIGSWRFHGALWEGQFSLFPLGLFLSKKQIPSTKLEWYKGRYGK